MTELVIKRARLIASLFPCVSFIVPPGDYLVTIEEKNNATYLRAYTNWRYQVHTVQVSKVSQVLHFIVFVNKTTNQLKCIIISNIDANIRIPFFPFRVFFL